MLSPQKLRNVTQQTLEDQEINRLVSLTQDFQNLLEQLPGLAETAARNGKYECPVYTYTARAKKWHQLFHKTVYSFQPAVDSLIINPLIEYVLREGFTYRISYTPSLLKADFYLVWKS